ncbi:MAG: helix-turn-helix domain-containing protein [Tannerellaceae bacterium]|jgi:AraC-like DNA-binding protein|nr:helix-turn-helix domain-containing protein [Tannerellaceae bacterium]
MHEAYNILSIFVTSGILLACGLMLLFSVIPGGRLSGNYHKARFMMAGAYLFFVVLDIVEYLFQTLPDAQDITLMQTITLTIAVSQAFLFSFAMLALLEVRFPGWRYVFLEAALPVLLVAAVFTAYACCTAETFGVVFYAFTGLYALLLVRYTCLFLASYGRFRLQMDNYFSDMEADRLRWVAFSFFAALAVGVMALLSAVFMSTVVALLFTIIFDTFYLYFAVRFINYSHQFQAIERAMDAGGAEECLPASLEGTEAGGKTTGMHADAFTQLEKRIDEWIAGKGFTEKGITIDLLAARLYTNSKYISVYINIHKKQTFREWINGLRIEEAKILLLQYPEMTVLEIASRVGIATGSHFGKQFRASTGLSPSRWREKELSQNVH